MPSQSEPQAEATISRKKQKQLDYQENKRRQQELAADAEINEQQVTNDGETPAAPALIVEPAASSKIPQITGLTGELAMQKMSKAARKKLMEEQKKEDMERLALKERIKKANLDREATRIQKIKDEGRNAREALR